MENHESTPETGQNLAQMRLQKLLSRNQDVVEEPSGNPGLASVSGLSAPSASRNPFTAIETDKPYVALLGKRNGYVTLATRHEILEYAQLPDEMLLAAKAWAAALERLGSPRTYWITLSEATPHLHIHLYPRWPEDSACGVTLFESRESDPQPGWTDPVRAALDKWALDFKVELA